MKPQPAERSRAQLDARRFVAAEMIPPVNAGCELRGAEEFVRGAYDSMPIEGE